MSSLRYPARPYVVNWTAWGSFAAALMPLAQTSSAVRLFAVIALFFGGMFFLYALKYYFSMALILLANGNGNGSNGNGSSLFNGNGNGNGNGHGLRSLGRNGEHKDHLPHKPFISVHLPLYNEPSVVDRLLQSCTNLNYEDYEVVVADDSSDETVQILDKRWASHPRVKISRRHDRSGFKGGALEKALEITDPRAEFIAVFDADFIPPPDILQQFLAYFYGVNGNGNGEEPPSHPQLIDDRLAVVQGYQWHILNASENWITRGIRTEFSGSYVIERSSQELLGAMKMISGSVFMIRADVLRQHGWGTSITEDWELTLRLYLSGYKVLYTPFIQAPSECVATFKQLARQRMRWAEGHTFNVKKYFFDILASPNLDLPEKLEFIYYAPYYLQSVFFILGTTAWLLSEVVFRARLPMLPATLGWALVFTNALSLVLMNLTGLFMERGVRRNWSGLLSFVLLTYLLVPYQAYAALKGLLEPHEGGWHRTQKTGIITDVVDKLGLGKRMKRLLPKQRKSNKKRRGGIDLGRRLGNLPAAKLAQRVPEPIRRRLTDLSPGMRIASGLVAVFLLVAMLVGVISDAQFAPNLAAAAIFVPIFTSLATERRKMATRIISVVLSVLLALTLLALQVAPVVAAPDAFYFHNSSLADGLDMDTSQGSGSGSLSFDTPGQTAHWYSSLTYPAGADDASISAGTYSVDMYFGSLPAPGESVDIAVAVYHTRPDGSNAQLITSTSTTIDSTTPNLLTLDLGSAAEQTFTQADPQRLRLTISVSGVGGGGNFTLNFDSASDPTGLQTPNLTVFDPALMLVLVAVMIPIVTGLLTQRRELAQRVISLALAIIIALALLSTQVQVVTAAPDAFYLHPTSLNDGEQMNTGTGSAGSSLLFDTVSQVARWYTELTYPAGGDNSVLDAGNYSFNMYFDQLPGNGWWDANYQYRQQITVSTGSESVGAGYSASLSFDHDALVTAGKADASGDDLRVVYWDGGNWIELDRVVDPYSNWGWTDTEIWFQLQTPIPANSSDTDYYIYYGNGSAGAPPADPAMVFTLADDFTDGAFTSDLQVDTTGSGSAVEDLGFQEAVIDAPFDTDAAIVYAESSLPFNRQFAVRHRTKFENGDSTDTLLGFVEDEFEPGVTDAATEDARQRIMVVHDADTEELYVYYVDTSDTRWYWDGASWSTTFASADVWTLNVYHAIEFYSDGTNWWIQLNDEWGWPLDTTDPVAWSDVQNNGYDYWFYWGDPYDDQNWVEYQSSNWIDMRDYVDPEPTTALGGEETPASNAADITVSVHHTASDGSNPQPILSTSVTIDSSTTSPLVVDLGSSPQLSFSSSDPQRLRVEIAVDNLTGNGEFGLAYDSGSSPSRLETPSLTVLDVALILTLAAILIPIVTALITERRRMATRLISVIISILLALALLSSQIAPVLAAPDSFYLHDSDTGSGASWYDPDWSYRRKLTVDNTQVSGSSDFSYFPVLVKLSDSTLADTLNGGNVAQSDGGDIVFTSANGTSKLQHEIESYDNVNGVLVAWVEVPTLSYNTDTDLYIYYGNDTGVADQWDVAGTWDEGGADNFLEVLHLDEGSGNYIDSTANGYVGTPTGSLAQGATGRIDGAVEFQGPSTSTVISLADMDFGANDPFTISAWFYVDTATSWAGIITKSRDADNDWIGLWVNGTQYLFGWDWQGAPSKGGNLDGSTISTGTWYYGVATFDGTNRRLYLNDQLDAGPSAGYYDGITSVDSRIGNDGTNGTANSFDGFIDEVRFAGVARSLDWIKTEYNNQVAGSTFFKPLGSQESAGPSPVGKYMDTGVGSGASTLTFDTTGQSAYWYSDLSYPTGQGDSTVAAGDYTLNMNFSQLPSSSSWWDANYAYRQQITVTNNDTAQLAANTIASFTANSSQLISGGKLRSDGNDWRVVYWNGSSWNEIPQLVESGWNSTSTETWFRLQAAIDPAASDTDYYIYYGYSGETGSPSTFTTSEQQLESYLTGDGQSNEAIDWNSEEWGAAQGVQFSSGTSGYWQVTHFDFYQNASDITASGNEVAGFVFDAVDSLEGDQIANGKSDPVATDTFSNFSFNDLAWSSAQPRVKAGTQYYLAILPTTPAGRNAAQEWFRWDYDNSGASYRSGCSECKAYGVDQSGTWGFYWVNDGADRVFHVYGREAANADLSTALGTEATDGVKIRVTVSHTAVDGSGAATIVQSSETAITSATADPLALSIGTGAEQTFTAADPQLLRVQIEVVDDNGQSFDLAYDSAADPTNLETPTLTVLDPSLILVVVGILIPVVTYMLTEKRRRRVAARTMSLIISLLVVLGILAQQITPAVAAPDAYYLHDADTGTSPAWYDTNWLYRKKLTIDSSQVPANQSDFTVLVSLASDADLAAKAQDAPTAGYDILFTDSTGTAQLSHEIEKFNDATGELVAWVELSSISSSADTEFYMYYGNSGAANQQDPPGTWSNGYESVYHLHDDFADATTNHSDATNNGSTDISAGIVGDAQSFNGSSQYIDTNWTSNYGSSQNFTWSGWFKPNSTNSSDDILGIEDRGGGDDSEIRLSVRDDQAPSGEADSYDVWIRPDTGTNYSATVAITNPEDGNWHYAALERDGTTARLFYDGSQVNQGTVGTNALNFPVTLLIGAQWYTDSSGQRNYFEGDLDEVRTSTAVRDQDWLQTEYNNISSPSTFFKPLGSEEPAPPSPSGKYINTLLGTGGSALTFDTPGQNAYWYSGVSYPTGQDDSSIASGDYTLNMYFSSLPATWYDSAWSSRQKLTIDSTQVADDLSSYPVLVSLTDSDLIGKVQADGGDILFTSSDGTTKLNHEIEKIVPSTGELVAWVELNSVSGSVDTDFYMYFDNPGAANQWNAAGTWDSNYVGVWHLDESGNGTFDEYVDSTANGNDGRGGKGYSGYVPTQASAKIGEGQTFDGVNDFIDLASSGWYDSNYPYRKRIVIDGSQVSGSGTFSNFPVLISVPANSDNDLKYTGNGGHVGKSDGTDIFFTNDEGTKLDHQIESYDPATGELLVWVEAPELMSTADTTLYLYYGYSSATDQQNVAGTWDAGCGTTCDYRGVWHLGEDPTGSAPQFLDSSNYTNDGTAQPVGLEPSQTTGQFENAVAFDDTNERHVEVAHDSSMQLATDITVSAWVKTSDTETDVGLIANKWGSAVGDRNYWLGKLNDTSIAFYVDDTESVTANLSLINDGTNWHYVVGVADASNTLLRIYVDGTQRNTAAYDGSSTTGTSDFYVGSGAGEIQQEFDGGIDEVRVAGTAHSADWIATEWNNQSSPSTFYQFLSEETPSDVTLDLTGTELTLEAWVKYDSAASDYLGILAKNGFADGYRLVVDDPSHTISFDATSSGGLGQVDTTGSITSDPDWHHIVGTWDGTTMRVYIDGSVDPTTDPRSGNLDSAGKEIWIGHGDHAIEKGWSYPFYGQLDEVRISDIARPAEWVQTEYNNAENQGTGAGAFLKTLGTLESAPAVDIVVSVYHTKPDGSDAQEIVTSSTITIDSNTTNPYALTIGNDPSGQTFSAADPRLIRLQVNVASVSGGGSFSLAYDSGADPSSLDTPTVTVPDMTLVFVALVAFVPLLTFVMTERRRRRAAMRLATTVMSVLIVLGLLGKDVATAVAAPDVFYLHDTGLGGGTVTYVDTQTTAQTTSTSYALPSIAGGTDQLYLIAVAIYRDSGSSATVSSISGTSLSWSLQVAQCSARISNPRIEIWQAFGSPSSFSATVNISGGAVLRSSSAISSYSGADPTTPTEGAAGSNYDPGNACSGPYTSGDDTDTTSLSLTSSKANSVLYVATHPRIRTITTPDPDYSERAYINNVNGGDGANLYVHDRTLASAGTDSADHTLSGTTDWDMAGLVINPASGVSPAGKTFDTLVGSAGSSLTLDTAGQDAYWYSDVSYPTGVDDSTIAAGSYTLNMYLSSLPSSGLLAKAGTFTAINGTGNQAVGSVGFQPKAVLLWMTDRTSTGAGSPARVGRGWTDGTNQGAVATAWDDGPPGPTFNDSRSRVVNDATITLVDQVGTLLAEADIVSLDSDGFTLDWTDSADGQIVGYLALGGSAVSNVKVGGFVWPSGNVSYSETGVGFQPDVVLLAGVEAATAFGTTNRGGHGFGVAISPSSRHSDGHRWRDRSTDVDSGSSGLVSDEALVFADDTNTPEQQLDLVSMDSDGFTLTKDVGPAADQSAIVYIALEGVQVDQGVLTQPTSTGSQSVSGLSFEPAAVIFDGGDKATVDGFEQDAEMVTGAATSASDEFGMWIGAVNSTPPYPSDTALSTTSVIESWESGVPLVDASADFTGFNSDGFSINWTTADTTQRTVGWVAFGPANSSVDVTVSVHHTDADGSNPQLITETSTTIDGGSSTTLALDLGSAAQQTFTQADPQLLRVQVHVDQVNGAGSFALDYDSGGSPSNLEIPTLVVPDPSLIFGVLAVFFPLVTFVLTAKRRRRMAARVISLTLSVLMVLGILGQDVITAVAAPDVFYLHDTSIGGGSVTYVDTQTTAQTTSTSYALPSIAGGTDQLYLIAVAIYKDSGSSAAVSSITGTSLSWSLQVAQCSARINNPRIEIWQAFGSPSSFSATVNISGGAVRRSSAAISSYSGADPTTPTEGAAGSNYDPGNACSGPYSSGDDTDTTSLSLTSSQANSVLYVATQPRTRTITTPDPDYTERAFVDNSSSGDGANLYVHDRTLASAGTDSADHTLSNTADWDMAGLVINPASGVSPAGKTFNTTIGSAGSTLTFDTGGQDAYWYSDISYPTGSGDANLAAGSYNLNLYFDSLPAGLSWWDGSYLYRRQVTVTAGSSDVPSGYSVKVQFDHQSLVSGGKSLSSGDDIRVVYWNGGSWVELDRLLDDQSSWDSSTTEIWFQTQALISASGSDNNYYIYYGNGSPGTPPTDWTNVFLFYDNFNDGSLDTGLWYCDNSCTESGGSLSLNSSTTLRADAAYAIGTDTIWEGRVQLGGDGTEQYYDAWAASNTAGWSDDEIDFWTSSSQSWRETGNGGSKTTTEYFPSTPTSYHLYSFARVGTSSVRFFIDGSELTPVHTTDIPNANLRVYVSNDTSYPSLYDFARVRQYVSSEPSTGVGAENDDGSVTITATLYDTATDGSDPQFIASSASTVIDSGTANPLTLSLGSASQQTFTAADPRLLRVHITVDSVSGSGSFDLGYDSVAQPSNLDTPVLTVPEISAIFTVLAVLIPLLTATLTMKRRTAVRLVGVMSSVLIAIGILASQVAPVTAAPDVFYLHDTGAGTSGWYDPDWQYRMPITIDSGQVGGSTDLDYFPVLIDSTVGLWADTSNGGHVEQSDGGDILFTAANGTTKLDHEIESYDNTSGALLAWVEVPVLGAISDTTIYIYYGNNTGVANQWNVTGTWDEGGAQNYRGVWHLNEASGNAIDATTYGTSGSVSGTVTRQAAGPFSDAYDYGTNGQVDVGDPGDGHLDFGSNSLTVSMWLNVDQSTGNYQLPLSKGGYQASSPGYSFELNTSGDGLQFEVADGTNYEISPVYSDSFDTWYYVVGVVDKANNRLRLYVDGSQVGIGTNISSVGSLNSGDALTFAFATYDLDGLLDEVRVAYSARTPYWIATEFNNQDDPGSFYSVSGEQSPGISPAGKLMNITQGTGASTLTFDTVGQDAYWYSELSYPTGADDATVAAGSYTANLYFSSLPSGGSGVQVDGVVDSDTGDTTSLTIAHTTSGTNRLMLVGVSYMNYYAPPNLVSSISYNSDPLTYLGSINNTQSGGDDAWVELYYMKAPDIGDHDVVVDFDSDNPDGTMVGVMTFTGVDQTTPLGSFAGNEQDGSTASVTVASAVNDLVFAVFACETCDGVSYDAPASDQWVLNLGTDYGAGGTQPGASTSTTVTASMSSPDHWAIGGVAIKPAAAGSVDLTVYAQHTATDGSGATLITSASTTIDSGTGSSLALDLGSGSEQTFTTADPRLLRMWVEVTGVSGGGSFTLAYDSGTDPSSLDTPVVTVPEYGAAFVVLIPLVPYLMAAIWRRRRSVGGLASMLVGAIVVISLLASQVTPTTAAPDVFYLHTDPTSGLTPTGEYMDILEGTGGGLDTGSGIDGSVTLSGSANLNTDVIGSSRSGAADGVATAVTSNPTGTSISVSSSTGFAAGDEILLINLQGALGDVADAGNYEFLDVASVPNGTTIDVTSTITNSYDGTTFANQTVLVQRVPQWTSVTINSGGSLTASAWNGTSGGIIAFRATGTVTLNGSGTIDAAGIGYQGGSGGSNNGGSNGESYDGTNGSGGADNNRGTLGGGSGETYPTQDNTTGTRGGGGGGGETGSIGEGGAGGAGGGYGGGGGGGGGGSDTANYISGAGGAGGTTGDSAGGGGHGENSGTSGDGGDAGNPAQNGGVSLAKGGGLAGSGATTGQGGHSEDASDSPGGGGGGGGTYGAADLSTIFFGSGGGGGGDSGAVSGPGLDGGDGGGIVIIIADTVDNNATIQLQGADGTTATDGDGAGGGGAGGSLLIRANSVDNTGGTMTAAGGAGGAKDSNDDAGGGGGGGVGRIRIEADTIIGSTTPAASTAGTPGGGTPTKTFSAVGNTYWYHDVAWPTGNDDAVIAAGDYTFNMYFDSLPTGGSWWDANYGARKQLTLTAPSGGIPAGYPVRLEFDHASLVSGGQSQSDGDDIRIVYWNGSGWAELDRTLFDNNLTSSAWNQSDTTIMFETQAAIAGSGTDTDYYLYYDYGSATSPPTNTLSSRYFVAESLGETQTSSSTYNTKVSLAFTPSSTSEQWVVVGSWRQRQVTSGSSDYAGESRITINGTPRTGTTDIGYRQAGSTTYKTFTTMFRITGVSSTQTIDLDFGANGNTDAIDNARLIAFMIPDPASADVQYAEDLPVTVDSSGPVDSLTLAFSPSSAGDYIWMTSGSNHEGPNGGSQGGLYAIDETDSAQQQSDESFIPSGNSFVPFSHIEQRALSTGSQSFIIRHAPDPSGSERQGLTILLFRSDVFDLVETSDSAANNSTTQTTYQDKSPVLSLTTASVAANHDYIYLAEMGMYESTRDETTSTAGEIRLDGSQQTEDISYIDRNGYNRQVTWDSAETGTGNRTLDGRYKSSAGQTAHALYGHITSLRYKEATISQGSEETSASSSVDITVRVHHTKTDGSSAVEITSASTTITSATSNPLAFDLGNDPVGQTFTSADPQVLQLEVEVTGVTGGGSFTLAYDGPCASNACSSLDTPVVTVPEFGLAFGALAAMIPVAVAALWRRRRVPVRERRAHHPQHHGDAAQIAVRARLAHLPPAGRSPDLRSRGKVE